MMRMMKNNIRVLIRSRFIFCSLILITGFVIYAVLGLYGKNWPVVEPLGNAMTLCIYLFIAFMFISYEYIQKFTNNGVSEVVRTLNKKNTFSAVLIIMLYSMILCIALACIVIVEFSYFKISDPQHEYIKHIVISIFVNIYLVMQLAVIIGASLACILNRVAVYSVMTAMILLSSPFAENLANSIDMSSGSDYSLSGRIAFKIISYFYILPRFNLKTMPRAEFGEPVLLYRIFIIFFWSLFFITVGLILRKKKHIYTIVSGVLCLMMFAGYSMPSSNMEDKLDTYQNGIPDRVYAISGMYKERMKKADYEIKQYDMKLDMRTSLKAEITMTVSENLKQYNMTLYRKYIVSEAKNQDGNRLDFEQSGDYLTIYSGGKAINKITIKMKGNSSDCYANYQGCYLPGYYLYYPRAGFLQVYNTTYGNIMPNFLDKDTLFKVSVSPKGRYVSNLKKSGNKYIGKCDGFTLLKGFYKKKDLGSGNIMVYPYLDEFTIHNGKMSEEECWKENFDFSSEQLKKDKIKDSMIFMDRGVLDGDGYGFKAYGKKQIFVNAGGVFYYSDNP